MKVKSLVRTIALAVTVVLISGGMTGAWDLTINGRRKSDLDDATSVAVDLDTGSIFVAGRRQISSTNSQFFVVKFTSDGRKEWQEVVEGTADIGLRARATVVAVDSNGFVFVAGTVGNIDSAADFVIMKIDGRSSRKHVLWTRVIDGLGHDDVVNAMALTPDGGVAVAGLVSIASGAHNFYLMKFTGGGQDAWPLPFPHDSNAALAAAVDVSGDFFAAGRTCSTSLASCFTVVRVGRNGKEVWRTIIPGLAPGTDEARTINRDPQDGNAIVAGRVQIPAGTAFAVFKLDANTGMVLWPAAVADLPLGTANALTLTSRNTVAVAGVVQGSFAVLEFDTNTGRLVSRGVLPGAGEARSVAFDGPEGTVVAGGSIRPTAFGFLVAVAKFDSNGTALWSENIGPANFGNSAGATVAVHQGMGAIAVSGTLTGPRGELFTTMLLRADGTEQWRSDDIPGVANSVAFSANNMVAVGQFPDGNTTAFAVIAFAEDGTEEWRRTFRGTADFGSNSANVFAVAEKKGAVFVAGVITHNPTGPDMFVVGLGVDGSDLSGFPGARTMATPSTRRAFMKPSAADLGLKDAGSSP